MVRMALGIEYDGSAYFGWQRQQSVPSVQAVLTDALSQVANQTIEIFCAGRTDSGVHATGQVVHFDTTMQRDVKAWTFGVNRYLPDQIKVKWAQPVVQDFHARFSALSRRYRYIIYNAPFRPAILANGLTHIYEPLDEQKMHQAAQCLLGENDFSSFRAAQCQSHTPWRNIHHLNVTRLGAYVMVDIQANAFVHHMVRNIVGSLIMVGAGHQPEEWIAWLLSQKDRTLAAPTAKAAGLYLVQVKYPEKYLFPNTGIGPLFLDDFLAE